MLACGVCHSDSFVHKEPFPYLPRVLGCEICGHVVVIGEGETRWQVGDRCMYQRIDYAWKLPT